MQFHYNIVAAFFYVKFYCPALSPMKINTLKPLFILSNIFHRFLNVKIGIVSMTKYLDISSNLIDGHERILLL